MPTTVRSNNNSHHQHDSSIPIRVISEDNKVYSLSCSPTQTVDSIHQYLYKQTKVPSSSLQLFNTRTQKIMSRSSSNTLLSSLLKPNDILSITSTTNNQQVVSKDNSFNTDKREEDLPTTSESIARNPSWRKAYNTDTDNQNNSRQDLLLHASLQLTEEISHYHQEIRTIYHAVRNFKKRGTVNVHELLPRLHQLVSQDRLPFYLLSGVQVVMSGWAVISTTSSSSSWSKMILPSTKKWVALYDSTFSIFKDEEYCRKYLLALSRQRRGAWSSIGSRMIKEYAPELSHHIQGWRAKLASSSSNKRTLVEIFDTKKDEDNVAVQYLSFDTFAEVSAWIDGFNNESQAPLLKLQQELSTTSCPAQYKTLLQTFGVISVPLKWLRIRLDRRDREAKRKRVQGANMTQVLKDITRDTVCINGKSFSGSFVEDILSEIAVLIMKNSCDIREMDALQFARRILVSSARTQGGGDVLDAVTELLQNTNDVVCIVPDSRLAHAVDIKVFQNESQVEATVTMKMFFKLLEVDEMTSTNTHDMIECTSTQECQLNTTLDVTGHVNIKLVGHDEKEFTLRH